MPTDVYSSVGYFIAKLYGFAIDRFHHSLLHYSTFRQKIQDKFGDFACRKCRNLLRHFMQIAEKAR